jgi:dihydroxyacetone kinase-like protein
MEMAGASISICRVADDEMKKWIDRPVHTPFYTQV